MTSRFLIFLSVVVSIWLVEHLYVGWRLSSLPIFQTTIARRSLLIMMAIGFFSYIAARILAHHQWTNTARIFDYFGGLWIGAIFLFFSAFLVADLVTLGGRLFRPALPLIYYAAAFLALMGVLAGAIGGLMKPRIIRVDLEAPGVAPTRILQISDLHFSPISGEGRLRRVINMANELKPDVIVLTGDLIDGNAKKLEEKLPLLRQITAPLGVYAVLGNHEFYAGAQASRSLFAKAGYNVLDNQTVEISPNLVIAGVPDARGAKQTNSTPANLELAVASVSPQSYLVLLQHSPENEADAAARGVDLMLSGHTHGGQVWPFHLLVRMDYSHISGVRHIDGMTQITSRGAGWWGPRLRLFAPADIVLITINTS